MIENSPENGPQTPSEETPNILSDGTVLKMKARLRPMFDPATHETAEQFQKRMEKEREETSGAPRAAQKRVKIWLEQEDEDGSRKGIALAAMTPGEWLQYHHEVEALFTRINVSASHRRTNTSRAKSIEVIEVDTRVYENALATLPHERRPVRGLKRGDFWISQIQAAIALGLKPLSLAAMFSQAKLAGRGEITVRGITIRPMRGD